VGSGGTQATTIMPKQVRGGWRSGRLELVQSGHLLSALGHDRWFGSPGVSRLGGLFVRGHAKRPWLGRRKLDWLVEGMGFIADRDVSLAAGPGVEGERAVEVRANPTQDVDVLGEGVGVPGRDDAPAA
jgi:hypothetical protein